LKTLGLDTATLTLLQDTMAEEKAADHQLTALAEQGGIEAAQVAG